jgi:hypothetical protein
MLQEQVEGIGCLPGPAPKPIVPYRATSYGYLLATFGLMAPLAPEPGGPIRLVGHTFALTCIPYPSGSLSLDFVLFLILLFVLFIGKCYLLLVFVAV